MATQFRRLTLLGVLAALSLADPKGLKGQAAVPTDSLERALQALVLARQPELAVRRAALATGEARLGAAGPRTPLALDAEIENIPEGFNLPDAGQARLVLEYAFLTGGRRAAAKTGAQTMRDVAAVQLDVAERSLAAIVDRDLAVWRGWQGVASRLTAEDSLLQEAERALQARFAVGEARYVDVLRLRTERLRVRSERAEALRASHEGRRQLEGLVAHEDSASQALRQLLGALADRAPLPPGGESLPPPPDVDSLLTALDLLRLGELRVDAARAQAEALRASRGTRFIGGVGVQRFGDADAGFTVGPSLRAIVSLPFTVSGSTRALNQAADLAVVEAQAEQTSYATALRTSLLLARDRYAAALERLQVYDVALLTGAREEREGALGAYRTGQLSLIELLDFERALARAETEGLRAAIDARVAYAHLFTTAARLDGPADGSFDFEAGND